MYRETEKKKEEMDHNHSYKYLNTSKVLFDEALQ